MTIIISLLLIYTVYIVTFSNDYKVSEDKKSNNNLGNSFENENNDNKVELNGDEVYDKILWSNVVLIIILLLFSSAFNI